MSLKLLLPSIIKGTIPYAAHCAHARLGGLFALIKSNSLEVNDTQDTLQCNGEQATASIRWARCLSEIAKEVSLLCKSSVLQGYVFISKKIMKLMRYDSTGRQTVPVGMSDQKTLEAWRNYTSFACGCPPHKRTGRPRCHACKTSCVFLVPYVFAVSPQTSHHF